MEECVGAMVSEDWLMVGLDLILFDAGVGSNDGGDTFFLSYP